MIADVGDEVGPRGGAGLVDRPVSIGRFPRPACLFPSAGRSAIPARSTHDSSSGPVTHTRWQLPGSYRHTKTNGIRRFRQPRLEPLTSV